MKDYFPNESSKKSLGFKLIMLLVFLMITSMLAARIISIPTADIALDPTIPVDPLWYIYAAIGLCIVGLVGVVLTYLYKKWGVYLVIGSLLIMILIYPDFSLQKTLLPIFTLFVFTGYGFIEIVPKWKFFK